MPDRLDHATIRAFWEQKSQETSNRWTSGEMLRWEIDELTPLARGANSILDLGSGHGELSRPLAGEHATLTAVDYAPAYAASFTAPNQHFVATGLDAFQTSERFDLVLLFGVVTCLDAAEERSLYARLVDWIGDDGTLIVKNQCALGEEFVTSGFSEALGTQYSGRYPSMDGQETTLGRSFRSVRRQPYPARFNRWDNSAHVAFECTDPIR